MKKIKVLIEWSGDNFAAGTGEVNGVVFSTGKTMEEAKENFEKAFLFHIKGSVDDGDKLPAYLVNGKYKFDYELQASAMLQMADGLFSRAAIAKAAHMNEKQLSKYLTTPQKARPETNRRIAEGIKILNTQSKYITSLV